MSNKMKKVVLALTLVFGFSIFAASPSQASVNEIDPKPALKTSSSGTGGFTLDQ